MLGEVAMSVKIKEDLKPYVGIVHFFAEVLGPDYEIALHDARNTANSIVAIANNHVSGRDLGAPLTDWAISMIENKEHLKSDFLASYNAMSKEGRLIRSSTFFIKNNGELIGLLCVNFDSSRHLAFSKSILQLCHPDYIVEKNYNFTTDASVLDIPETFSSSVSELTQSVIQDFFSGEKVPSHRLTKKERLELVNILNTKGIFNVKGAVSEVAQKLGCSESTIYRYLNRKQV